MHELSCPSCNATAQYEFKDYMLLCPFCSATFVLDLETGRKEMYSEHFIVPNGIETRKVQDVAISWLKRMHHNPYNVEREFFILDIHGYSIPYWIISLEAHTTWQGLVRRLHKNQFDQSLGGNFVGETGQFRRNYRWAVSGRSNICENWGLLKLHQPKENVLVDWDGFPLDSTYSRGRIDPNLGARKRAADKSESEISAYEMREPFEFKFSNGVPILAIQTTEEEALARSKWHVDRYHHEISKTHVDVLTNSETELEIAGIQLIHLPFWFVKYTYKPNNVLKYIQKSHERNLIVEGYSGGVLKSELAMIQRDKLWINSLVTLAAAFVLIFIGIIWHPSFLVIGLFALIISGVSAFIAMMRKSQKETSSFFHRDSIAPETPVDLAPPA